MNEIYFDNAATTCLSEAVKQEVIALLGMYGNPSSLHNIGLNAERAIKKASKIFSEFMDDCEIIYTSGGTESNNTAIFGVVNARRKPARIVTAVTEHPSVLEPFRQLEKNGYDVIYLPVDKNGHINIAQLSESVNGDTCLVSIMAVNNETGSMQDIEAIGREIKRKNAEACFHVDGVQMFGKHAVSLKKCKIDLFSVSGHKIHAPKGIGALFVKKGTRLAPLIYGGGQQRGLRSGTENVTGISAFAVAAEHACREMEKHEKIVIEIKETMLAGLKRIEGSEVNGGFGSPYILNASFEGVKSEVLLHALEKDGIYVSAGSACSSRSKHNGVLEAYGLPRKRAETAIRFSFSRLNTVAEAEYTVKCLERTVPLLRGQMLSK